MLGNAGELGVEEPALVAAVGMPLPQGDRKVADLGTQGNGEHTSGKGEKFPFPSVS